MLAGAVATKLTEAVSMKILCWRQCPWLNSPPWFLGSSFMMTINNKKRRQMIEASASVCMLLQLRPFWQKVLRRRVVLS